MITAAEALEFDGYAQDQAEALYPADISLDSGATAIACSGGVFADSNHTLGPGGIFPEYQATFRVRTASLGTVPAVGTTLIWRRGHSGAWESALRIARVVRPPNSVAVVLACEFPTAANA